VYAMKVMSLTKLRLQRNFERISDNLHREIQILFGLRHPRIVSLYDVVEDHDSLNLVMELVEGGELFDYIVAKGAFSEPEARHVFLQIAEGLKYIHSKDIVYRDLKPENILVDRQASKSGLLEVKLSDFGHSKLINNGYSTALTRVGTPQYWAPEVCDPRLASKGYDQTVDLWSLGVVCYVMLCGAYPFDGAEERMEDQIRKAHLTFRSQVPGHQLTPEAKELVRSFIKVKPQERLKLEQAFNHRWVKEMGGAAPGRLMKVHTEVGSGKIEERIRLPIQPSKDQVDKLRRDLQMWMAKFKCFANVKQLEVIATLDLDNAERIEAAKSELLALVQHHFHGAAPSPTRGGGGGGGPPSSAPASAAAPTLAPVPEDSGFSKVRPFRLLNHYLRVSPEHGAGLDLQPEKGGMRIRRIFDQPGQPGLKSNDLITTINEVPLRGNADRIEEIFGRYFADGAQLSIKRER